MNPFPVVTFPANGDFLLKVSRRPSERVCSYSVDNFHSHYRSSSLDQSGALAVLLQYGRPFDVQRWSVLTERFPQNRVALSRRLSLLP